MAAPNRRPQDDDDDVSNDRRNEIRQELLTLDPAEIPEFIESLDGVGELQVANEWLVQNGLSDASVLAQSGFPASADPNLDPDSPEGPSSSAEVSPEGLVFDPLSGAYTPAPEGATANGFPVRPNVDPDLRAQIQSALDTHPSNPSPTPTSAPQSEDVLSGPDFEPAGAQHNFEESTAAAVAALSPEIARVDALNGTVDQDALISAVEANMPEGLSPSDQQRWREEVWGASVEAANEQRMGEQESVGQAPTGLSGSTVPGNAGTPFWLLQATGYGELTTDQQNRLVEYWNDVSGTAFSSYEELVSSGALGTETDRAAPSALVQRVVEASILASEPIEELRIDLPGVSDALHISLEEQDILRGTYGLSTDGIVRLARLGNLSTRIDPETGRARPVNLFELAAVAAAYGMQGGLADQNNRDQQISQLESQIEDLQEQAASSPRSAGRIQNQIRRIQQRIAGIQRMNTPTSGSAAGSGSGGGGPGMLGLQNMFYRGLDLYGQNQTLALIHTVDQGLASRIAGTGGDPNKLNSRDSARAWDILIASGVEQADPRSGFRPDDYVFSRFASYFGMDGRGDSGGGGGGRVRRLIDPEGVRQQVKGLWQGLFLADAPEDLIKSFSASLQEALDKAPQGMEFDVSARITDWLKGQSVYRDLYGAKDPGVSEQDYQAQFMAGSASMLGNETADPSAVQAGMRTGEYQTTVGAAFAQGLGSKDNSTLQERLARAANVVAQNT